MRVYPWILPDGLNGYWLFLGWLEPFMDKNSLLWDSQDERRQDMEWERLNWRFQSLCERFQSLCDIIPWYFWRFSATEFDNSSGINGYNENGGKVREQIGSVETFLWFVIAHLFWNLAGHHFWFSWSAQVCALWPTCAWNRPTIKYRVL
jgi:hypothetical protein